jgi:glycosyltransferase involved in cell wall biosynthesis
MAAIKQPKLCYMTTIPSTFNFLKGQIGFMKSKGFGVVGITSPTPEVKDIELRERIHVDTVPMTREITPVKDLMALLRIIRIFRKQRPAILNASTPKASLLGVLAARITHVPVIIYTLRGLPFVTKRGIQRYMLIFIEWIVCRLSHRVITTSYSTKSILLKNRISSGKKIYMSGKGTANGIDCTKAFNLEAMNPEAKNKTRQQYGIQPFDYVVGYVGRIVYEKGIEELAEAWALLKMQYPNLYLMIVGEQEPQDSVSSDVMEMLFKDDHVVFTGHQKNVAEYYIAMDLHVLPSHREGLGLTPLEAGAMEIPSVVTNIDGLKETVINEKTGIKVPVKDPVKLAEAIDSLLKDPEKARRFGQTAREMVQKKFRPEIIWNELLQHYLSVLKQQMNSNPL